MTGCRHGAKNTLNENYLYLAEKAGAVIHPMTTVVVRHGRLARRLRASPTAPHRQAAQEGEGPDLHGRAGSSSRPARTAPRPCCTG